MAGFDLRESVMENEVFSPSRALVSKQMSQSDNVSELLRRASDGDRDAQSDLYYKVSDELRKIAKARLRMEHQRSIQTTELIDDAFLKIVGHAGFADRAHFFRVAARAMRQILVDRARKRERRPKHASGVPVDWVSPSCDDEMLPLDAALNKLETVDQRASAVVELRFFAGQTIQETAEILGVSPGTVKNDWAFARAWLMREISSDT